MKIIIQLSLLVFIGVLTPFFIGLLFLVTPVIWLWRKVAAYFGRDAITDADKASATVNNSFIRDRILWSN
jgi:predicted RND superfamily exporter protein